MRDVRLDGSNRASSSSSEFSLTCKMEFDLRCRSLFVNEAGCGDEHADDDEMREEVDDEAVTLLLLIWPICFLFGEF